MAKLVETRLLRRLLFDVLKPTSESGDNPYLLTVNGAQMWIYIKNLSPAYFSNPDVWRAQLPKRDLFEDCKKADLPFILLGYDDENDVYTTWNHRFVKQRLNVAESVSFYSRASLQKKVADHQDIQRLTLSNDMEVLCFPRSMVLDVVTKLDEYFPDDESNYVALNSKRRPEANNTFKVFTSLKNIPQFIEYLRDVKGYSEPTANNYSGAIRRFINKGIFTKYRADFLAYDDIFDYSKAIDVFLSHEDIEQINIASRHVHSNALIQYIDYLCDIASDFQDQTDDNTSDAPTKIDWEEKFIDGNGKLSRIANPELIELLRPVLQTEYPRIASAYNIIYDFYGSRFDETMELKDWSLLIDYIDWDYKTSSQSSAVNPYSPKLKKWTKKGRLSVTFPDGSVLSSSNSTQTFLAVLEQSFPDLIIEMGIEVNGGNIIHTTNDKPRLKEIKGGFFVDVNYRTDVKVQILRQISDELELNLIVEQVDSPEDFPEDNPDVKNSDESENSPSTTAIIIPSIPQNTSKRDRIRVTFPDGYVICNKVNKDTLVNVVTRAGIEAVFNLRLNAWGNGTTPLMSESPLIGYEKFCVELAPCRYLLTNSSTPSKITTIQRISDLLGLNLKIELLEGTNKT
ncbi:MAG: hypothetical protein BHV67_16415 [Bacteroidales bacterium 43_36]|nr:MAG: hypothetical protein BHV67_16415 [Bacteroidales bacterium 43_36]